jgi:hypothetical protein
MCPKNRGLDKLDAAVRALSCLALVALLASCSKNVFECSADADCDLESGGQCLRTCAGNQFCAYPTPQDECAMGLRWTESSTTTAGENLGGRCVVSDHTCLVDAAAPDASEDAGVDAGPQQAAFDIAHVSRINIPGDSGSMTESEWIRLVNVGARPLDLSAAEITDVSVDDDRVTVAAFWTSNPISLEPARSGGRLSLSGRAADRHIRSGERAGAGHDDRVSAGSDHRHSGRE